MFEDLTYVTSGKELPPEDQVKIIDWPPQTPDLNPNENLLVELKIKVYDRRPFKSERRVFKEK